MWKSCGLSGLRLLRLAAAVLEAEGRASVGPLYTAMSTTIFDAGLLAGSHYDPLTGVFATRSPVRPNLVALTLCKIVSVKENVVEVEKIDAFDDTPVIDIKPYAQGIDQPESESSAPAWTQRDQGSS